MTRLAPDQKAASSILAGPVRIVAGAGTGKTAVIAERFRALVAAGADPRSILVMTFTERAATEMRERIEAALDREATSLSIGTFHALCQSWLREDGQQAGVPAGFRILAGADRWIFLRELLWESGDKALVGVERPDDLVTPLLGLMERMKQELVSPATLRGWAAKRADPETRPLMLAAARLFAVHAHRCRAERLLDFDDLLVLAVRLFERRRSVLDRYRRRYRHLMVDEYQDTNLAQERIVELLAGPSANVCVVGDDDQSIYRFRGASRANLERFLCTFPATVTVGLGRNHRSGAAIVDVCARLIESNRQRLPKDLVAVKKGGRVEVHGFADGEEEAAGLAARVLTLAAGGVPLRAIAVLARTNAALRPQMTALGERGIPYQAWGARGLLDRPEVRDIIAYLRVLADESDEVAIARLLDRAAGVDLDQALALVASARGRGVGPLEVLSAWEPAAGWVAQVRELAALVPTTGVDELLFELLSRTSHLERAPAGDLAERNRVVANGVRFADLVQDYCERALDHSLGAFLKRLDLILLSGMDQEAAQAQEQEDAVQVMTIHQAKGLEFDAVLLPCLVEGRLPQPARRRGLELPGEVVDLGRAREDHLAEERRLCYVAMTRARRSVWLSWASSYEGSRRWRPSRFLDEMGSGVSRVVAAPVAVAAASSGGGLKGAAGTALPSPRRLSFTAISSYRECPRQYWYRYRHRLPAQESVEAQFGTVIHEVLKRLGEARMAGGELTDEMVRRAHAQVWAEVRPVDPRRLRTLRGVGLGLLRTYLGTGALALAPVAVERSFVADLGGWSLAGVVDRIDRLPDADSGARWRLVDYKTGAPLPASRLRRDFQLALYALGARSALALPQDEQVELEIAYLRESRSVRLPAGEELVAEAEQTGRAVAEAIENGRFEARPERRRCRICAYRLACADAL